MTKSHEVQTLAFDLFGTILDLGSSLRNAMEEFLRDTGSRLTVDQFWSEWRTRQRLEQYRDTIMMIGHSGYLETVRRSMRYVAESNQIAAGTAEYSRLMDAWWELSPFDDVLPALERLRDNYGLVILSNGDPEYLDHLVQKRVCFVFDCVYSVTTVGRFKPHPSVYRNACLHLNLPYDRTTMVSSNSFDAIGAKACGLKAAYVNRYSLPMEESPFVCDLEVKDFAELADSLLE